MTVTTSVDVETQREMYRRMLAIRRFEEAVGQLFRAGRLPGFVHLSIGQEAVPTGVCIALRADDYITSNHRGHGHLIAKGGRLKPMFAELYAKSTGYCKGKGGSMHIAATDLGILGANGIVGAGLPIACGAAFSAKQRGTDQVAACFFGDGAANESNFGESLNLAAAWQLPVVFVCEDNQYGLSNPRAAHLAGQGVSHRAQAYGIPSASVDGMEVLAVYEAVTEAVRRARSGGGPTLLECHCYRFVGHFEGDSAGYRPAGELEAWRQRDPIQVHRSRLISEGIADEAELEAWDRELADEIQAAVRASEADPEPAVAELRTDVYSSPIAYPR